ncbi:MAG: hypothetical protein ACKOXK_03895 [Chakrabartia sp.]
MNLDFCVDVNRPLYLDDGREAYFVRWTNLACGLGLINLKLNEPSCDAFPTQWDLCLVNFFTGKGEGKYKGSVTNDPPSGPLLDTSSLAFGDKLFTRDGRPAVFLGRRSFYEPQQVAIMGQKGVYVRSIAQTGRIHIGLVKTDPDDVFLSPPKPKPTVVFRNVYSDGSMGTTAHKTIEVAKLASKVNKERIGILAISSDGNTALHRCKPFTRTSGYVKSEWVEA